MSAPYASFEGKDFSVESNTRTAEQLADDFKKPGETVVAPEAPTAEPVTTQDDSEGDESEITPSAPEKIGKPHKDMRARMLEATREKIAEKKRADEIERRANQLEAELRRIKEGQTSGNIAPASSTELAKAAKADGRPKLDDYDSLEDHAEAVANWVADNREKASKEARQTAEKERETEERFSSFSQRMSAHLESDPDFWSRQNKTVVELRPFSVLSAEERAKAGPLNALAEHFLVSDKAPALIEYFSGKPDELDRLSRLHPGDFWREVGRIEARLGDAPTASSPQPVSKAAPPARSVTGGPPTANSGPSESDSDDDYIRKRRAQEMKRRTAR